MGFSPWVETEHHVHHIIMHGKEQLSQSAIQELFNINHLIVIVALSERMRRLVVPFLWGCYSGGCCFPVHRVDWTPESPGWLKETQTSHYIRVVYKYRRRYSCNEITKLVNRSENQAPGQLDRKDWQKKKISFMKHSKPSFYLGVNSRNIYLQSRGL